MIVQFSCGHTASLIRDANVGDSFVCRACSLYDAMEHRRTITAVLSATPAPAPHKVPSNERLQEIRDADAAAGEGLQMAPPAWQDRRDLLAYIDATTEPLLTALKVILTFTEYWDPRTERFFKEAVGLVSQLEGKPFDAVAYSHVVAKLEVPE